MYLSLSVPSDRVDVFRAAAVALLAAAAIISLISLISRAQELEAEINSFRLSGGGPAARSSAGSAADPTPTASPTVAVLSAPVLTAQASEDGVELSWTTVHGATRYELFVWDSVNEWRQIGGDSLTGTTYTHTDLVAGTTYFYTILAVNADGETSALSDHVSTDTPTATPTATPTHTPAATVTPTPTPSPTVAVLSAPVLTAQAAEDGVELSWTTVHGATRYEIFVWDSVNEWRQIGGDSLTGTTYTHTDLVAGTTYFYTILAVNADGETSALSDHVSTDTPTATPTATPTHTPAATVTPTPTPSPTVAVLSAPVLTAQAAEDGVELSWTTVHGATRYELFVWDSVNEWRQIGGDSLTGTTYTHTDLVAGTTYFYTILAVNADGETSALSDHVSTDTPTATPTHTPAATVTPTPTPSPTVAVLSAPVLTAQAAEDGVELSWTTVHGATRYELFVWDSVNEWRQIGGDSLTGTTYTHTDLVAGTTYFYTILAVNADGETSALSDHVSTDTPTATPTHTPAATVTPTPTPTATTGQPSDSSAADPTPTPSPTVAVLSAPVLTAQAAEDGVELSWTTVHGATRYELFVWDSVNEWRQIGGDSLTGTTYTHTDLVAGTTYFYTILAVNADGETSALSDHVSTDTPTATPTHTPAATVTPTPTPTATTGQPSDSSQNGVTVKDDSGNEGNVGPGQTSEDKTRTEPRQGVTGPTVTIAGAGGIVVVGGANQVNGASFDVTITFSENVGATFDHTGITVTNAQSLTATDVSASTSGPHLHCDNPADRGVQRRGNRASSGCRCAKCEQRRQPGIERVQRHCHDAIRLYQRGRGFCR